MAARKEVGKERTRSKSEKAEKIEKSERDGNGKPDSQGKLDTMITHINKSSSISDLIASMNMFNSKLDKMVSTDYIDKALKKLVTEDFVKSKLNELRDELTADIKHQIKSEVDKVNDKLGSINLSLEQQATEIEGLKSAKSDMLTSLEKLRLENKTLKKENSDLKESLQQREIKLKAHEHDINDLEQYTRMNSVRIYGVDDRDRYESSSKTAEVVINLINTKLELSLQQMDVDVAHRLGRFRTDGNRPIICKFVSRETKGKVIKARRKLKGSPVVIREDLTLKNAKLLETVTGRPEIKKAWSDDGKIIALLHSGEKVKINLQTDLDGLLYDTQ